MIKRKVEVIYYEKKKGSSRFNPWAIKDKTKLFDSEAKAKAFAKKIHKKTGYLPILAWAYKTKKGYASRQA